MAGSPAVEAVDIQSKIHQIRDQRVVTDFDLAGFYGVPTRALNQAVKRNAGRFPDEFCFQLTHEEFTIIWSRSVIKARKGRPHLPWVFTEHGALMAATVLNSPRAIQMSLVIIRAFAELKRAIRDQARLADKLDELEARIGLHDDQIAEIVAAIRALATLPPEPDRRIGFHRGNR